MRGSALRVLGAAALVASAGLLVPLLTVRIPPGLVGVRTSKLGGGIEPRDHPPGIHLAVPVLHEWTLLGSGTRILSFGGDRAGDARPSLEVRTRDDNEVRVDLAVTFRIRSGEGHRLVAQGLARDWLQRVRTTAEDVLRGELRELSSEDWFATERRREMVERVAPIFDERIGAFHVELENLLVHEVAFRDELERKLQGKQISEQRARLATARRRVEDAEATIGLLEAEATSAEKALREEWRMRLQEARAESELALAEIAARAERYERRTCADADAERAALVGEGELALALARGSGEEQRMAALSGRGGRLWLARRAAEGLAIESVELDSTDPRVPLVLDLDALARLLVGGSE